MHNPFLEPARRVWAWITEPRPVVAIGHDVVDDRQYVRSDYYAENGRRMEMRHEIGTTVVADATSLTRSASAARTGVRFRCSSLQSRQSAPGQLMPSPDCRLFRFPVLKQTVKTAMREAKFGKRLSVAVGNDRALLKEIEAWHSVRNIPAHGSGIASGYEISAVLSRAQEIDNQLKSA